MKTRNDAQSLKCYLSYSNKLILTCVMMKTSVRVYIKSYFLNSYANFEVNLYSYVCWGQGNSQRKINSQKIMKIKKNLLYNIVDGNADDSTIQCWYIHNTTNQSLVKNNKT